jgi:hypothetical protein
MLNLFYIILGMLPALGGEQYELVAEIPTESGYVTTDNLGNLYIAEGDVLKKYDSNGKLIYEQSYKLSGTISFVDATQALRPLVYYQGLTQLAFLDNTLSIQGEPIDLELLELEQATLVCNSNNSNSMWLFNQEKFQLQKVDKSFTTEFETGNLSQQLDITFAPTYMVEYNNWLYVNNPSTGILIFDLFGSYSKTIPINTPDAFQVIENSIYFIEEKQLKKYDMRLFEPISIELPEDDFSKVRIEKNRLYLQTKSGVKIYALK